jgi:hypothetical protein
VAQVSLAEDDDMIKAFPSDRADQPFSMSILPWRSWPGWSVANAHGAKPPFAAIEAHSGAETSVAGDGVMGLFGGRSDPLTGAGNALRAVGAVRDAIDSLSGDLAGELERPHCRGA